MDVQNVNGFSATNFLADAGAVMGSAKTKSEESKFQNLLKSMQASANTPSVASSQVNKSHKLTGDYTQGFSGSYTSEQDKTAKPQGFAANAMTAGGKQPVIDRTSELYEQSMELENYMVKMMLSSARKTVGKSTLFGKENEYAREMYEDMMYDNYAESLTKNAGFGLADQIYIELSGQR